MGRPDVGVLRDSLGQGNVDGRAGLQIVTAYGHAVHPHQYRTFAAGFREFDLVPGNVRTDNFCRVFVVDTVYVAAVSDEEGRSKVSNREARRRYVHAVDMACRTERHQVLDTRAALHKASGVVLGAVEARIHVAAYRRALYVRVLRLGAGADETVCDILGHYESLPCLSQYLRSLEYNVGSSFF